MDLPGREARSRQERRQPVSDSPEGRVGYMSLLDGAPAAVIPSPGGDPRGEAPDQPAVAIDAVVAGIWSDVLGVDCVRPDDDFFDLGGDSLSAVQILSRVAQQFNFKVTEGELFTARTVRGLGQVIGSATAAADGGIRPVPGRRTRFPATASQRRLWILDHIMPNPEVYNVGALVRVRGEIDVEALRAAFEQVDARQEALRVHFATEDGLPVQVVGEPRRFKLPFTDLRDRPEGERTAIATAAATACASSRIPLDGERLWRVKLYQTEAAEFLLWVNMHHTITDGWSLGVFFRDLEAYYEAARSGRPARVRPLPVQYGDYANWEQERRQSAGY